jgi:hypothetical protein
MIAAAQVRRVFELVGADRIVRLCPDDFSASQGPELRTQVAGDGQQGPGVAGQQRPVPRPQD